LYGFGLVYAHSLSQGWLLRFEKKKRKKISFFLHSLLIFPLIVDKSAIHLFAFAYSFLFLPMAYPFAFLSFASFLTLPFTRLLNGYAGLIRQIVGFFARFDVVLGIGPWGPAGIMAFYLFLGAALFFFDSGLAPLARRLVVLLIALLAINASPFTDALSQSVSFINVGQGDAILIRDGLTSVLIDTGGNLSFDMAEEVDIPFLRRERVRRLECLILTHDDFDHSGAADSLRRRFPVSQCVGEASSFPLRVGRLIFVNHNIFGGDDDNEKSLVLGLAFMGKRWLFMGDAPLSIEAKMLETHEDLQADVLKVGHHGSKTSSGEQFLKAVSPAVAVISVGAKNPYGHPDPEVLSRLESLGITVRRTDQEGTIAFRRFGPCVSGFSSA
jgi:competence protein ComEC